MLEDDRIYALRHFHRLREVFQSLVIPDNVAIPIGEDVGPRSEDELTGKIPPGFERVRQIALYGHEVWRVDFGAQRFTIEWIVMPAIENPDAFDMNPIVGRWPVPDDVTPLMTGGVKAEAVATNASRRCWVVLTVSLSEAAFPLHFDISLQHAILPAQQVLESRIGIHLESKIMRVMGRRRVYGGDVNAAICRDYALENFVGAERTSADTVNYKVLADRAPFRKDGADVFPNSTPGK